MSKLILCLRKKILNSRVLRQPIWMRSHAAGSRVGGDGAGRMPRRPRVVREGGRESVALRTSWDQRRASVAAAVLCYCCNPALSLSHTLWTSRFSHPSYSQTKFCFCCSLCRVRDGACREHRCPATLKFGEFFGAALLFLSTSGKMRLQSALLLCLLASLLPFSSSDLGEYTIILSF